MATTVDFPMQTFPSLQYAPSPYASQTKIRLDLIQSAIYATTSQPVVQKNLTSRNIQLLQQTPSPEVLLPLLQSSSEFGDIFNLIPKDCPKIKQILTEYSNTLKSILGHFNENGQNLTANNSMISQKTVMKTILMALTQDVMNSEKDKSATLANHGKFIDVDGESFLVKKENEKLSLVRTTQAKTIGQGKYGQIQTVLDLTRGKTVALKIASPKQPEEMEKAKKDIKNEALILRDIHRDGKVEGIQSPPLDTFDISSEGTSLVGFTIEKYDADLCDACFSDENQIDWSDELKLQASRQLLSGLASLSEKGYKHGDIKLENILVKKETNGEYLFDIADLGDAIKYENYANGLVDSDPVGSHTEAYTLHQDCEDIQNAAQTKDWTKFEELSKQRDVFSMGVVLYRLYTGELPSVINEQGYLDPIEFDTIALACTLEESTLGSDDRSALLYRLITSMLAQNPAERPSAEEALNKIGMI